MSYSRDEPSPRYLQLKELYRTMHERGESFLGIPPERTFPGSSLLPQAERIKPLLAIHGYGARKLSETLLLDPDATDRLLSSFGLPTAHWAFTDDNLYLEYSTPKGNVLDGEQSLKSNLLLLRRHAPGSAPHPSVSGRDAG